MEDLIITLLGDAKGWTRVATLAILCFSFLAYTYLRKINTRLKDVKAEFSNNGGATLRDQGDRQEELLQEIKTSVDDLGERVTALESSSDGKFG